ncbi:MarR family winged helix-turn-helix transcriptional regulator [Ectobacillus panaciterrae]|uniref:MarR family winged helix-turn-helix transcriptional regulator n=1 Tax=Ectobacillus panaciterrae TaxID=363872 RepID=UPI000404D2AF|nr:MarR family transcriptional regulator [Ectobacillus panaciterrae]
MNHREWEHIVNHLLSLVPLFYRKFMLPGDAVIHKNIPQSHTQILLLLHDAGTLTVSEIGSRLAISRPNMTPLLNKLIEEDFIKRHYSKKDRRVILISLTDEGEVFIKQYKQFILDKLRENLDALSEEELKQLSSSLETLQAIVAKVYMASV